MKSADADRAPASRKAKLINPMIARQGTFTTPSFNRFNVRENMPKLLVRQPALIVYGEISGEKKIPNDRFPSAAPPNPLRLDTPLPADTIPLPSSPGAGSVERFGRSGRKGRRDRELRHTSAPADTTRAAATPSRPSLPRGVTVAQEFLVLFVKVRILAG